VNKIKAFTDLKVWNEGHKLVLLAYKETQTFPREEMFGLSNHMRRSAVSITSGIDYQIKNNSKRIYS
jgi:four helix bundle protein